jgi:hypothetical protein
MKNKKYTKQFCLLLFMSAFATSYAHNLHAMQEISLFEQVFEPVGQFLQNRVDDLIIFHKPILWGVGITTALGFVIWWQQKTIGKKIVQPIKCRFSKEARGKYKDKMIEKKIRHQAEQIKIKHQAKQRLNGLKEGPVQQNSSVLQSIFDNVRGGAQQVFRHHQSHRRNSLSAVLSQTHGAGVGNNGDE